VNEGKRDVGHWQELKGELKREAGIREWQEKDSSRVLREKNGSSEK
jgi:hypothetical protein